jgi:FMN phosphatase YigB (HAD superfamily)
MTDAILPHALPAALDRHPGARVLSLDCFDTLLWRDTHMPADVFARLSQVTPLQRIWAETRARQAARFGRNCHDVSISEIYGLAMPNATPAERAAAIQEEIAAEAHHCFAFAPTVELMRQAKARGLHVVIVSDTYLDPKQLRELIARAAGDEVAGLIDRIFCSSTYGKPKSAGLYGEVLRKLSAKPHEILHIGDNRKADVDGVRPFGVNTLHLEQFSPAAERRFRHEAAISGMFHLQPEADATAHLPHRAALALAEPRIVDPAEAFGLSAVAPVLYGFERWLQGEAAALEAEHGGTVHWLFLMRDGHLPMLVHEAATGEKGVPAEISRFTATAASLRRETDPQRYVELEMGACPRTLARQLQLSEAAIAGLMDGLSPSDASYALLHAMRKEPHRRAVVAAGRGMAKRLVEHVRALAKPARGDTLMLVDLGYNGSVQDRIDDLLRDELGVHVAGRYLLLREQACTGLDKRGLIDAEHYDLRTLVAMTENVALLEQVCTTSMGSVADYAADGAPIRKVNDIKGAQSATRDRIQAGCLAFVAAQRDAIVRAEPGDEIARWRKGAASALGRVMFLPFEEELSVIASFEHDVNLGTDRTVALFDPEVADRGLRQRGLFYLNGNERMYLPAELKGHGLAPKLALLANRRFGLPFSFTDFSDSAISLPIVFAAGDELSQQWIEARATHDGYYMAAVPIGDCRYSLAIQFGVDYEYLQIDSISAVPVAQFLRETAHDDDLELPLVPLREAMDEVAPGLFRCADEGGFMMVHPPARIDDTPMMVAVVFRPIAQWRRDVARDLVQPLEAAA